MTQPKTKPHMDAPSDDRHEGTRGDLLHMAGDIVAAYVGNNPVGHDEIPDLIRTVFNTLSELDSTATPQDALTPAVPVAKSIMPDYLVCLEDGKKLKMLKRYLRSAHGLSPEEYRAKWSLPADYPMVAPNYAKKRSEFAKQSGLGKGAGKKKS